MPEPPRNAFQYAIVRRRCRASSAASASTSGSSCCAARGASSGRGSPSTRRRLAAFAPDLDPATIRPHLERHRADRRGRSGRPDRSPGSGQAERFHWLVAPSSTIIQPSEVHTGLCDDPAAELDHLVATLVD